MCSEQFTLMKSWKAYHGGGQTTIKNIPPHTPWMVRARIPTCYMAHYYVVLTHLSYTPEVLVLSLSGWKRHFIIILEKKCKQKHDLWVNGLDTFSISLIISGKIQLTFKESSLPCSNVLTFNLKFFTDSTASQGAIFYFLSSFLSRLLIMFLNIFKFEDKVTI